jgi:glycosyltransferase XagB
VAIRNPLVEPAPSTALSTWTRQAATGRKGLPPEIKFLDDGGISADALRFCAEYASSVNVTAEAPLISEGFVAEGVYYSRLAVHLGAFYLENDIRFSVHVEPILAMAARAALLAPNDLNLRAAFAPRGEALRELVLRVESGRLSADAFAICAPQQFDAALRARFSREFVEQAAEGLARRDRHLSAVSGPTVAQVVVLLGLVFAAVVLAWILPSVALLTLQSTLWLLFLLSIGLRAVATGAGRPEARIADLADESLPIYSVIVPLHREAEIIPQLLAALGALDYPVLCGKHT